MLSCYHRSSKIQRFGDNRDCSVMSAVKNVCIFGGTHGNEMSGVCLLKKWKDSPGLLKRSSFETKAVISNPEAVKLTRRYRDCDLNRSFTKENLEAKLTADTPYEIRRANELTNMLSAGGEIGPCQVLIDLHNTTSNMKMCLIHRNLDKVVLQMIAYVNSKLPENDCRNLYRTGPVDHATDLAPYGIGLEVGPQPQGVLRDDIMLLHEKTVMHCLDFIELFNSGVEFQSTDVITYQNVEFVTFPRDSNGEINATIHPSLQDKDWEPIKSRDPVFRLFDGTVLLLSDVVKMDIKEGEVFYPCFVNEAAYYEKDVAFFLTKQTQISVPALSTL